ncbi:MAG TPA: hypothetical protein VF144_00985 [Chitinophagaceae bacterium]
MRPTFSIGVGSIFCFIAPFFISCKERTVEKESWAVVMNFISPDTAHYPELKQFPFPDSLRFISLERYFTIKDKAPVISDSAIIFYDTYWENNKKLCCNPDTLEIFTDTINGKKYLFVINDYITVFQSNTFSDSNLRARQSPPPIPFWGIRLNTPYPPEKFKDQYEKLGAKFVQVNARFDEVDKQTWSGNDSILVETIQFQNSNDRIITSLSKDLKKSEADSIIDSLKNIFPAGAYQESVQIDSDGKPLKTVRIYFQGVAISINQVNATDYTFMLTDYYETIKLIINNAETRYTFRDDIRIY